jgi:hypothetical protein
MRIGFQVGIGDEVHEQEEMVEEQKKDTNVLGHG